MVWFFSLERRLFDVCVLVVGVVLHDDVYLPNTFVSKTPCKVNYDYNFRIMLQKYSGCGVIASRRDQQAECEKQLNKINITIIIIYKRAYRATVIVLLII